MGRDYRDFSCIIMACFPPSPMTRAGQGSRAIRCLPWSSGGRRSRLLTPSCRGKNWIGPNHLGGSEMDSVLASDGPWVYAEKKLRNHFLSFVLALKTRDYLVSNDGNQVHVSELEGKTVAPYFWPGDEFTPTLIDVYNKLKAKSEKFEILSILWPWNKMMKKSSIKNLKQCRGPDGKILKPNAVKLIDNYGVQGYPFTPERLDQIDKARLESQTLESLLVSGDKDFVIAKGVSKVPLSELVGKTILLCFLCSWCRVCTRFTPKLIEIYQDIKAKDDDFELIFICNCEQDTFDELLSSMPWLALPFDDDARRKTLMYSFKIRSTPNVVVIGPSGQTATSKSRELINVYGVNAYPFTEEHLQHLEEQMDEIAKGWPKKLKHALHAEHEFSPTRHDSVYWCEACLETGIGLYFKCEHCYFGLHPKCALKKHYEDIEEFFCEGNESHKV
ncbi:Protein kinase C-like [Parasponia andersonii]|uniref:protein-disulfide reductase n=1 Tax=Parasponia andersonii TaxID=3476 RepID=A0A2P5CB72_PARAD|nr:Protein kinase C-like [Parasponia andersonii]